MRTPERPLLKPWYRLAWSDTACLLEYGGSAISLEGAAARRLLPALLPLLDGRRTVAEIEATLGVAVAPAVEQVLAGLARAGALTEGPSVRNGDRNGRATAIAELLSDGSPAGDGPWQVAESLGTASVAVAGAGEIADTLAGLLEECGVGRVERVGLAEVRPGRAETLLVAAPHPREVVGLQDVNELALLHGLAWLQLLPFDGRAGYVGPLFLPGATCCHRCFTLRWASTSGYRDELAALEPVAPAHGLASPLAATVGGLGSLIALRWLSGRDPRLPGRLWALELQPAPSLTEHLVYRVPRCPACSQACAAAPPSPWFEAPVAVP
jgi:bacteriocin biosynthesis cyclodehydratase domain-containing protein